MIMHRIIEELKAIVYAFITTLIFVSFSIGLVYAMVKLLGK